MTILNFPRKVGTKDLGTVCGGVWQCGCGCQHWVLYENGVCLCPECNCISTVIKCSADSTPVGPAFEQGPCPACGTTWLANKVVACPKCSNAKSTGEPK